MREASEFFKVTTFEGVLSRPEQSLPRKGRQTLPHASFQLRHLSPECRGCVPRLFDIAIRIIFRIGRLGHEAEAGEALWCDRSAGL